MPSFPSKMRVNLKDVFEQLRADILINYPELTVFTFNIENLNQLFDQLIYASLDYIEGANKSNGFNLATHILMINGLSEAQAKEFATRHTQSIIACIQRRIDEPIVVSGARYRPVYMRYNLLELRME